METIFKLITFKRNEFLHIEVEHINLEKLLLP